MAYQYYSPARACYLLLPLQPLYYYLWFMVPHTAALSFSYNFSNPGDLSGANITYLSNNSTAGDGAINLTKNGTWSTGGVAYPHTVRLWDHRTGRRASFTTDFTFAISNSQNNERGDGIAFFIGAPRSTPPPDSNGGFLGLFSNPDNGDRPPLSTVGVEFDTNRNHWDPPETIDHIGIDVNNINSGVYYKALGNDHPNPLSGTMSARVRYDGSSKILSVRLWLNGGVTVHDLERPVDLKAEGVPQDATVGFSAATGPEVESHQLFSWSFNSTDPSKVEPWVVILISLASALLAASVAALLWVIMHRQRRRPTPPHAPPPVIEIELKVAREFSYQELSAATSNFSKDRMLGKGAFGEVYRGELRDPDKQPVAVKSLLEIEGWDPERIRKDYRTEITTLGQLSHRNLVRLVGWCNGGGDRLLLVYDLVTNGSLDKHLHGPSERLLTWAERYKIVRGIGSAIEYLHTGMQNPILHRDIKPSNVMLDDDFEAKLGDFGLVRQVPREGYLRGTAMMGSNDYIDPVCIRDRSATTASDVYSFGVLLLEVATGKDPAKMQEEEGRPSALIDAVRDSYDRGTVLQEADRRLKGNFDQWQMERVLVVGLLCVQSDRHDRPSIREAVYLLSNPRHPLPVGRV